MAEETVAESDESPHVLVSPAVYILISHHYARTYNILNNVDEGSIDVCVNEIHREVDKLADTLSVSEIGADSRLGFYLGAFREAYSVLRSEEYEVYHHMVFGYRMFNPLIIAGTTDDLPVLIGPAEAGHDIPPQEFHVVVNRTIGIELPETITKIVFRLLTPILDYIVNPFRKYLFAATLRNADRIVVVHSDARDEYAKYVDEEKLTVIPYGVDMDRFTFDDSTTAPNLITIGNLIPRKGHRYLLEAMPEILEEVPEAHLHVVGTGPLEGDLKELAADLDIEESVTFHGYISDEELLSLFHDVRAFVHPSLSEGFSHVRLEAMATGTPVVGTDVDGAHDLTRNGTDGFVVPRRDSDALAEATLKLLTDEERARKMGRNAREKVERDHDYADIGGRYLDIYRELAGEKG